MGKIFKTAVEDFEIIDIIIELLEDSDLKQLINENAFLKHMCKKDDSKRFRFVRNVAEEKIRQLYKKDTILRKKILLLWEVECNEQNKFINSIDSPEKIIDQEPELGGLVNGFKYCTILWQKNNKEFNDFGDRMFKEYKVQKSKKNKQSIEGINMNNDIMSLSLGECIQALMKSEKEIKEMKANMEVKDKEIIDLKNELSSVIDNRELKKEIKVLTRSINEVKNDFKEKNLKLVDEINEVRKENIAFRKSIKEISGVLGDFNSNLIIKEIIESQNNINNSLKGSIIESTQKNIELLFKEFEKKLNEKMKSSEVRDITTVDRSKIEKPAVETPEEKIDFEKLLENYF